MRTESLIKLIRVILYLSLFLFVLLVFIGIVRGTLSNYYIETTFYFLVSFMLYGYSLKCILSREYYIAGVIYNDTKDSFFYYVFLFGTIGMGVMFTFYLIRTI